jgi:hypothetical protein
VGAGPVGGGSTEGETVVTGLGDVLEVLVRGFFFVGCVAALLCEVPEGDVFMPPELVEGISGGMLKGHGAAFSVQVHWWEWRDSLVRLVLGGPVVVVDVAEVRVLRCQRCSMGRRGPGASVMGWLMLGP